jgi:hypothetical protein
MIAAGPTPLAFVPFLDPVPVWDYWYLLVLPLCVGIAVVWKSAAAALVCLMAFVGR